MSPKVMGIGSKFTLRGVEFSETPLNREKGYLKIGNACPDNSFDKGLHSGELVINIRVKINLQKVQKFEISNSICVKLLSFFCMKSLLLIQPCNILTVKRDKIDLLRQNIDHYLFVKWFV